MSEVAQELWQQMMPVHADDIASMFSPYQYVFPFSVHLSLPLSSSLPASLSDESLMTPDAENAVVSPILPFLYLGNEKDAQDLDLLRRLNIGYVVNVTTHLPLYHVNSGLRYKRLPATDNSKQNLRQYFEEGFEFIGKSSTLTVFICCCC